MSRRWLSAAAVACSLLCSHLGVFAETAPFDLKGPDVEVRVNRGGKLLPIAMVPSLEPGDRVRIHPNLPDTQSVHYLLVVAFMRGVTNPPPPEWFTRAETWKPPVRDEGIEVTVPKEAQQAVIFLAPETSGDIKTLRNTVRGRPGSFVRAIQDLNLASLDRARVDTYLEAMHKVPPTDEADLKQTSTTLARSLSLKINQDCFMKMASEQAQCLTQNSDQMVVDAGQNTSVVAQLTSGATSDLAAQLSYTPTAGAGYYSAYVGAIFDVARILDGLHTAQYQYIPALMTKQDDTLHTKLNNPPSFHNPKSVIVIALPPVEKAQIPRLAPVDPKQAECLEKPKTVLSVIGDPAVFATEYGHNFVLEFEDKKGNTINLPATPDAAMGGFRVDGSKVDTANFPLTATGYLKGNWGFDPFTGPSFTFDLAHPTQWQVANGEQTALIVGRTDTLHLTDEEAACVSEVDLKTPNGSAEKLSFKVAKPSEIEVQVPMKDATPGAVSVLVKEWGMAQINTVAMHSYAEAGRLDKLTVYAGDPQALLFGSRLDEVTKAEIQGVTFNPGKVARHGDQDELTLVAANASSAQAFNAGDNAKAKFTLKDGRVLELPVVVSPPRPRVTILSRDVQIPENDAEMHLTDQQEVPQNGGLTFSLKTVVPAIFPRTEKIEVSSDDGALNATLSLADSSLVLEDATTMLATLDPLKSFGPSIFGPLRFRPVAGDGTTGDWQSLGDVVRLPIVEGISCPRVAARHAEPLPPPPAETAPAPAPPASGTAASASPSAPAPDPPPAAGADAGDAHKETPPDSPATDASASEATAPSCTLHGTNLFLIDGIASDAAFTHSVQVPEGFPGQAISVPRPVAHTLYVKLRDDPTVVNTLSVPHD